MFWFCWKCYCTAMVYKGVGGELSIRKKDMGRSLRNRLNVDDNQSYSKKSAGWQEIPPIWNKSLQDESKAYNTLNRIHNLTFSVLKQVAGLLVYFVCDWYLFLDTFELGCVVLRRFTMFECANSFFLEDTFWRMSEGQLQLRLVQVL